MGGNALSVPTRRYSKAEYNEALVGIRTELVFSGIHSNIIKAYDDKESFGDLDLVIVSPTDVNMIKSIFAPKEIVKNGNVVSFDYKELQVDFIFFSNPHIARFATDYFSFNDLSNFMGRTAHAIGYKLGHDGLWYVLRDKDHPERVVKQIRVSCNFDNAIQFLGFDAGRYRKGFKTAESIFDFAASSPYFQPEYFFLANRNHTARVRDKKRRMYNACVEYYKTKFNKTGDEVVEVRENRDEHLLRAFDRFPSFKREYDEAVAEHQKNLSFKLILNGNQVRHYLNIDGIELGEFMRKAHAYVDEHNLKDWISTLYADDCQDLIQILARKIR